MGASFSLETYDENYLNNNNNNNSDSTNSNNNNSHSDDGNNLSFFERMNIFNYNANNNNNRQSFINITEEELEYRRKQRESERTKSSETEREHLKRHNSAVLIQKYWKGFSQRKKYSLFLTKIQVFKELLSTEKDYIQFLEIIIRVYATPLRNLAIQAQKSKKDSLLPSTNSDANSATQQSIHNLNLEEAPLTLDEVKIVFSQIEVILLYNSQLFEKLRSRLLSNFYGGGNNRSSTSSTISSTTTGTQPQEQNSKSTGPNPVSKYTLSHIDALRSSSIDLNNLNNLEGEKKKPIGFYQQVGDIFLEMIDFLKVPYSHYIINFPACLKVLEVASKRPAFMLFSQQCKSIPEVGRRDIQSFVSMPIQRIPRYVLLLRELLKFTVPGHSDHTNIELAVKRMEDIANLINRQMKEDDSSKEVFLISQKLRPPIPNLVEPHRKIIKEGSVKIYKADGNNHESAANAGTTIRPSSILSISNGGTKYIYLFNDLFVITKKKKTYFKVEKIVNLEYSTIIDNYKQIKILQEQKQKEKEKEQKEKSLNDSSDSDSDSGSNSNNNNSKSPSSQKSGGERFYFKLHTLDFSIVICLSSEAEKELWKSNFITVINRLTENSLSFNPKWSKNDLIYGEDQKKRRSAPRGSINPNNFTLTKSIAELLALSKPIKGMGGFDQLSTSSSSSSSTTTTTSSSSTLSSTTNTIVVDPNNNQNVNNKNEPDTTTSTPTTPTSPTTESRSRSASISAGLSGTFERIMSAIKS